MMSEMRNTAVPGMQFTDAMREGYVEQLIKMVYRKAVRGMDVVEIADILEEDETQIQEIVSAASRCAPDHGLEKIYINMCQHEIPFRDGRASIMGRMDAAAYILSLDAERQLFHRKPYALDGKELCEGNVRLNRYLRLAQKAYAAKYGRPLLDTMYCPCGDRAVACISRDEYGILLKGGWPPVMAGKREKQFLDGICEAFRNLSSDELDEMLHEDPGLGDKDEATDKQTVALMSLEEAKWQMKLAEARKEGREEARKEGENKCARLVSALVSDGRIDDILFAVADEAERERLYREYGI